METVQIEPLSEERREWARQSLLQHWGDTRMVRRGQMVDADGLPGFVALVDGEPVGLVTYQIVGDACEILTIHSLRERRGVGSALIAAVKRVAQQRQCRCLWLVTTNDNLPALRFYQKRGFYLTALRCNAMEATRRLKPQVPLLGLDGIPLRDELELEMSL
ncbi:MAG TPA: GNAT family N-acetyltransferase [Chthonomonadaceae bacterium]|nr:GNAT family N-acetyltransferase [Chthonomonadaceae bacterium]